MSTLGISHDSVSTILHDRLGMRPLTVRWVPKSLSDEQMATRAKKNQLDIECQTWLVMQRHAFHLKLSTVL